MKQRNILFMGQKKDIMPEHWNIFAFICQSSKTFVTSACNSDTLNKKEWYMTAGAIVDLGENFKHTLNFLKVHESPTILQSWMFFMTFNMRDFVKLGAKWILISPLIVKI